MAMEADACPKELLHRRRRPIPPLLPFSGRLHAVPRAADVRRDPWGAAACQDSTRGAGWRKVRQKKRRKKVVMAQLKDKSKAIGMNVLTTT